MPFAKRAGSRGCVGTGTRYCRGPAGRGDASCRASLWRCHSSARPRSPRAARDQVSGTFMPQKVRIALDAMGGDVGASVVIPGAAISLKRHPDSEFLLYRRQQADRASNSPAIRRSRRPRASSIPTLTVSMHDKPSQALRRGRKNSSMWLAIDAVKKGEADVAVSAGNTGALMAMARFHLHTHAGHRPAGDCRRMADGARRFRRARPRRQHRRRCASSGVARGHGQRDGERAVRPEASDRRPAQYRGRGGQGRRGNSQGVGTAARDEPAGARLYRLRRGRRDRQRARPT